MALNPGEVESRINEKEIDYYTRLRELNPKWNSHMEETAQEKKIKEERERIITEKICKNP